MFEEHDLESSAFDWSCFFTLAETFFDHLLRSGESYSRKRHYVCENPVRAGLAGKAEDWPYTGEIFALEYRSGYQRSAVTDRRYRDDYPRRERAEPPGHRRHLQRCHRDSR